MGVFTIGALVVGLLVLGQANAQAQASTQSQPPIGHWPTSDVAPAFECIRFSKHAAGELLQTTFSETGLGPVTVSGFNPQLGNVNAALIFDSAAPTGDDFDLGTPNAAFGGPGQGPGGDASSAYANRRSLGKLLILAENLEDANGDGLVDSPDDADAVGASLQFNFGVLAPVEVFSVTVVDVENARQSTQIVLLDSAGNPIKTVIAPNPGDNGVAIVSLSDTPTGQTLDHPGVASMRIEINGSGGFDDLCFRRLADCDDNGVADRFEVAEGLATDLDRNGVPDACDPDCDMDGIPDALEADCDGDLLPDDCEGPDCDGNGVPDDCDLASGAADLDGNGVPDVCDPDCDEDGIPDAVESDCNSNSIPDDCEELDCDGNGIPDDCDIAAGAKDLDGNGSPDVCDPDCDGDCIPDVLEEDCDSDGIPDDCAGPDCDRNGLPDNCDIANGAADVDLNGVPDLCEFDCNGDGIPDGQDVSGSIWRDCNCNGFLDTLEVGEGGLTVAAYAADGSLLGSTLSDSSGSWYLAGVADPDGIRIVFPDLPSYLQSACPIEDNGSRVQLVYGPRCDVMLGVYAPADFCQLNPDVTVPCYINGTSQGGAADWDGIVRFPYDASGIPQQYGGNGVDPVTDATISEVGAVWGMAWRAQDQLLFGTSFLKRHSGMGLRGEDGVYVLDYSSGAGVHVGGFDLQGVLPANGGAAIDLGQVDRSSSPDVELPFSPNAANYDADAFAKVGKVAFGDADLEEDKILWMVNLHQRALIEVDVQNYVPDTSIPAAPPSAVNQYLLDDMGLPSDPSGVMRPWALKFHDGRGYLGAVLSAEFSQNPDDLQAFVFSFDPRDPLTGLQQELSFDLGYVREEHGSGKLCDWLPWVDDWSQTGLPTGGFAFYQFTLAQPILSDIEFTEDGSMVLALMDRQTHMAGALNFIPIPGNPTLIGVWSCGDILHACRFGGSIGAGRGGWTLEDGLQCPVNDDGGVSITGLTTDGPSGAGEFYYEDEFPRPMFTHPEVSLGALALAKGTGEVVTIAMDPVFDTQLGGINSNGMQWHSTLDGHRTNQYQIVPQPDFSGGAADTFGKGSSLGDLEVLCDAAPIELGNWVFEDLDGDGLQSPGDQPIAGVVVALARQGSIIGISVTDSEGRYRFGDHNVPEGMRPDTAYQIAIQQSDGALAGRVTTSLGDGSQALIDSDADPALLGGFLAVDVITGCAGATNYSYDFGFLPLP